MKSVSKFNEGADGTLEGTMLKAKMGEHIIFRIANADLTKFKGKKYHAVLTLLE